MASSYPADRFDAVVPDLGRVGAHRGPVPRSRIWIQLGAAVVAVALLTTGGWLVVLNGGRSTQTATGGVTTIDAEFKDWTPAKADAVHDSDIQITVLNGTDEAGLAANAQATLDGEDWNVVSALNANSTDIEKTTVYYSRLDGEGAARALAEDLGGVPVELATIYQAGTPLTVVLGSDYQGA